MNPIEWKIGNKYLVDDIMNQYEAVLEGFIVDQIPMNWKDKSSHTSHSDGTVWFVLSFFSDHAKKIRYILAKPDIRGNYSNWRSGERMLSWINLYGQEYGDSKEELLKKLKKNYVFTKNLSYDAVYKEGYVENN